MAKHLTQKSRRQDLVVANGRVPPRAAPLRVDADAARQQIRERHERNAREDPVCVSVAAGPPRRRRPS
jgi:hypothetical protein